MGMLENHMVIGDYYEEPELEPDEDAAYERLRDQQIEDAEDCRLADYEEYCDNKMDEWRIEGGPRPHVMPYRRKA